MSPDLKEAPRCTATAKGSGERCKRRPIPGGTVCVMHGGKAPQVAAAAEQREFAAKADAEVKKLWVGLDAAPAVTDPVGSLARLAGSLEQAVDVVGAKVNDLGSVASGSAMQQLRGEVVLLERLLGQLRQTLDAMARLGIEEKQVELQAAQAEIVVMAVRLMLDALHGEVVGGLSPAVREHAIRVFLRGLGRGPEQLEAGGGAG